MAQRDREGGAGEAAAGRSGSAGCGMVPPGRLQGRGTIPLPPRSCLNTSSCQFNCCPACSAKCRGPQPPPAAAAGNGGLTVASFRTKVMPCPG